MPFIINSKNVPHCCGSCPCFHAETPMYCQAVKADENKKIVAPYKEGRPEWCPISEKDEEKEILIQAFVEACQYLQKVGPALFIEENIKNYLNYFLDKVSKRCRRPSETATCAMFDGQSLT